MFKVINVMQFSGGLREAVAYFHAAWPGLAESFYLDAMDHSSGADFPLPRFYLLLKDGDPIGCYGLVTNDFISRHDLFPWFAALYVAENERGQALGSLLLEHGVREAARAGFSTLYLTTDHNGYYEKYGWIRIEDGYDRDGEPCRIYRKKRGQKKGSG